MHVTKLGTRVVGGAGLALVLFGSLASLSAMASGYGQGNFDEHGTFVNQVGVENGSLSGYSPAPFAYDTTGGSVTVDYSFAAHRYTGPNHVPYTSAIDIPVILRVAHVWAVAGTGDSNSNVSNGDPAAGPGPNPPFSEAYLLAHSAEISEDVISTQPFTIHFDGLPAASPTPSPSASSTPGEHVAAAPATAPVQTQPFTFHVTVPACGYYEVDSGQYVDTPGHANGFAVLTSGFVRATGCPVATPAPTSSVQGITTTPTPVSSVAAITTAAPAPTAKALAASVTVPDTGADPESHVLPGVLLIAAGMALLIVQIGIRRNERDTPAAR